VVLEVIFGVENVDYGLIHRVERFQAKAFLEFAPQDCEQHFVESHTSKVTRLLLLPVTEDLHVKHLDVLLTIPDHVKLTHFLSFWHVGLIENVGGQKLGLDLNKAVN
jgi:hypothetical protein